MRLQGTYVYGLDRKGRLVLPAAFRAALGESVVFTRGPDETLYCFGEGQWEALCRRHAASLYFRGYYQSGAQVSRTDGTTGRVLIPHELRRHAGLARPEEIVLSGAGAAVLVLRRTLWRALLDAGNFSPFAVLERELGPPSPFSCGRYSQEERTLFGLPVIACRGAFTGRATARLLMDLQRRLLASPEPLLLDLREAEGADRLLELLSGAGRQERLWVLTPDRGPAGLQCVPDLETALWRLAPVGERPFTEAAHA